MAKNVAVFARTTGEWNSSSSFFLQFDGRSEQNLGRVMFASLCFEERLCRILKTGFRTSPARFCQRKYVTSDKTKSYNTKKEQDFFVPQEWSDGDAGGEHLRGEQEYRQPHYNLLRRAILSKSIREE